MTDDRRRMHESGAAPGAITGGRADADLEGPPPGVRTMAVFRWVLIFVMAVIAALSVTYSFGLISSESASAASVQYYCPMHPQVSLDHPGECPICSMTLVKKQSSSKAPQRSERVSDNKDPTGEGKAATASHAGHRHDPTDPYACPMHPEETGVDDRARCAICGMKLEKRPSPAQGVPGLVPIELGMERVQTIGVRTASATLEELVPELRTVGFVSADEARLARVHTRFSGWIELVVPVTGQKVARGQVLARIYNLELLPAQQEFLAALRWSSRDQVSRPTGMAPAGGASLERDARARLELFGLSPAEIDGIAKTGKPARTISVTSPIAGHVIVKNAVQGAYVQTGTELFEIADLTKVWVLADVYEYEVGRVRVGQVADVLVAAFPNERFSGKIAFIYPIVDATTRTLRVRLELDNRSFSLRPGMYGDVLIHLDGARGVSIPAEGLIDTGEFQYVFVMKEGGRFEPRRVHVGARSGDKVQITGGLLPGEIVVTTANFLIDSESRLRATIEGSSEPALEAPR